MQEKRITESIDLAKEGISLAPKDALNHVDLGSYYLASGQIDKFDKAEAELKLGITLVKLKDGEMGRLTLASAHEYLGELYIFRKDKANAYRELDMLKHLNAEIYLSLKKRVEEAFGKDPIQ